MLQDEVSGDIGKSVKQPAIVVQNLVKHYGKVQAVNDISFTVVQGETFGLLGPNGAGKTTTLEMIEGLRRPDSGSIIVSGIDVTKNPRQARRVIGVQLQEAGLFDDLTVRETVRLFAAFYDVVVNPDELLQRLQLSEKSRAYVGTLSGGQKQRLSIALALVNNPDVVFLDEPTTGLDPQARHNLWDVIRSIQRDGRTVVLTTHYMDEAEALCDRIAIVDGGKLIALDTPARLIQRYAPGAKVYITFGEKTKNSEMILAIQQIDGVQSLEQNETGEYVLYTRTLEATVTELLSLVQKYNISYRGLRIESSDLEDVFLKLTGRSLRD